MQKIVKLNKFVAFLFLLFVVFGCENNYFPISLKGNQIVQLLSGGSSKIWVLASPNQDCKANNQYQFKLIHSDTLGVIELRPLSNCEKFDSIKLGKVYPTVLNKTTKWFTDSLVFVNADNSSWIIESITSQKVSIKLSETEYLNLKN